MTPADAADRGRSPAPVGVFGSGRRGVAYRTWTVTDEGEGGEGMRNREGSVGGIPSRP